MNRRPPRSPQLQNATPFQFISVRNGDGEPEAFIVTRHEDSREMMVRRRPYAQDAKRLVRLRHRRLLNFGDDVAFFYAARGGRAGWRNRGYGHDRLPMAILSPD